MGKRFGAILLAVPLSAACLAGGMTARTEADAGAQQYQEGCAVSGVLPCGESPVIVEKESIRFDVGTLPAQESETVPYAACVTTEYTLYNPEEEDVTLALLFPQTARPAYFTGEGEAGEACQTVTLNGKPVQTEIRHSYVGYYNHSLDIDSSLAQIADIETEDAFYADPELPVCEYLFHVSVPEAAVAGYDRKLLAFALTFECNPARTRVLSESPMTATLENGRIRARFDVTAGENEIKLTTIGEGIENLSYGVYTDLFCTNKLEIGSPYYYSESYTTFPVYAEGFRPEGSEISSSDWFSGFVRLLVKNTSASNKCMIFGSPNALREEAFMPWYFYQITVPAQGRAVHTVSAPLYPTLEENGCEYSYLLSSQQRWSKVKSVEIAIRTRYRLAYSSLAFEEREEGYVFRRDRLPVGELTFTLADPALTAAAGSTPRVVSPILLLALFLLGGLAVLALAAGGTVAAVMLARRKKRAKAQRGAQTR